MRLAAWERRHLLEAYDRVGKRNVRWDAAARRFISEHGLATVQQADREKLLPQGRALLTLGCDDPLVLYLQALDVWWTDSESTEPTRLFEQALEGMKKTLYPRGLARFVASGLYRDYERSQEGRGQRQALAPVELQWFREALADGSYGPGDESVLARHLLSGSGESFFRRNKDAVCTALEAAPGVEPWLRRMLSGRRHIMRGYDARGRGYADAVTPEGWKGFERELALARKDLTEAWRLRPDRPEIAVEMMELVKAGNVVPGETMRQWFDRAVDAQMNYRSAYTTILQDLRPRWHGSHEEMLDFARECVETGRYDTPVPGILLEALELIEKDEGENGNEVRSVYRRPEVLPLVARVVEGYLAVVQDPQRRRALQTSFVLAAHKAGQDAQACERILALNGDLDPQLSSALDPSPRRLAGRICALASPAGGRLGAAEARYLRGESSPLAAFEEAAGAETRPLVLDYLRHRIASLRLESQLLSRRWVAFLPSSSDLAGWEVSLGTWTLEATGILRGTSGSKGMMIRSAARVGPDFEVRGEYEFLDSSNGAYQAGVLFGRPDFSARQWLSLRIKRNSWEGEVAGIARHFNLPHLTVKVPVPKRGRFRLVCWKGLVTAEVNGTTVETDYAAADGLAAQPDALVGFGGYQDSNVFSVRYRRVELRRLSAPPNAAGG